MAARAAVLVLVALLGAAGPALAQSPKETIQAYTEKVLAMLRDTSLREIDTPERLQAAVRKTVIRMFGVSEAAREALGSHWEARTPKERDEFVDLFAELLEVVYLTQINKPGTLRLRYLDETIDGDRARVGLLVLTRHDVNVNVEVRLVRRDERWLVWDVVLDGISVVSNYRAQFDRVLRRGSYEALVASLRARIAELSARVKPGG
jgi:phospholipid transport system substrate-binding protein